MNVTCYTFLDLKINLEHIIYSDDMFNGDCIRYSIEQSNVNEFSATIVFRVTAVIDVRDGQYLLEFMESTGIDHFTADGEASGTKAAEARLRELAEIVKSEKLKLLPGVISV